MKSFPAAVKLSNGTYGTVYHIDQDRVAKVPHDPAWVPALYQEADLQSRLYEAGISVPKPEGIFTCHIEDEDVSALVMEYIPGTLLTLVIDSKVHTAALASRNKELTKARLAGFIPGDAGHNVILTPQNKVVLIDFGNWSYATHSIPV